MFIINGSKTEFTQWEQDITLKNTNMAKGDAVQFYSASGESAIMYAKEENGTVVVEVPNRMLQFAANITARLVKGGGVTSFAVKFVSYKQPAGYNFKDNEHHGRTSADSVEWSNVQNKPFETVDGVNITWDGDTTGLVSGFDGTVYKISDEIISKEDLLRGSFTMYSEVEAVAQTIKVADFMPMLGMTGLNELENGYSLGSYIGVATSNLDGGLYPEKGTYFFSADGATITNFFAEKIETIKTSLIDMHYCTMFTPLHINCT